MEPLAEILLQIVVFSCFTPGVYGNLALLNDYVNTVQSLGVGAIVGIVIGAIVLIAIIIGVIIYVWKGGKFMTFAEKKTPGSTKTPVTAVHPQQQQQQRQTTVVTTTTSQYPAGPPPTYAGPNAVGVDPNNPPPPMYPMPVYPNHPQGSESGRY